MRRILVTGSSGFVGRHVVSALAQSFGPASVTGLGREAIGPSCPGTSYHALDLRDEAAVADLVSRVQPTDILHLAAVSSVQQALRSRFETWRVNVADLLRLVETLSRHAPRCNIVFVSSGEIYGRAFRASAVDETIDPVPIGSYAWTKRAGEIALLDVVETSDMKLVILRPFNHIGPGQDERFVVSSFAGQIARLEAGLAEPVVEVGNLAARRDFLDVEDVVRAYVTVFERIETIPSGSIFNISSGVARTIESVLQEFRSLAAVPFGVRPQLERMRASEVPVACGDSDRFREALSWKPTVDWSESLRRILADARTRTAARPH